MISINALGEHTAAGCKATRNTNILTFNNASTPLIFHTYCEGEMIACKIDSYNITEEGSLNLIVFPKGSYEQTLKVAAMIEATLKNDSSIMIFGIETKSVSVTDFKSWGVFFLDTAIYQVVTMSKEILRYQRTKLKVLRKSFEHCREFDRTYPKLSLNFFDEHTLVRKL
jgi:hypothetical protein